MLVRRLEAVRDTLRRLAEPRGPRGTRRSRTSSIVEVAEEVHSIIKEAEFFFAHAQYLSSTEDEADQTKVKEEDKKVLAVEVQTTKYEASKQTSHVDAGVTPESTHAQVGSDGQATKRSKAEASSSVCWTRFAELGEQEEPIQTPLLGLHKEARQQDQEQRRQRKKKDDRTENKRRRRR